jgi:hypothetical protein
MVPHTSGSRRDPIMEPLAAGMSNAQIAKLTDHSAASDVTRSFAFFRMLNASHSRKSASFLTRSNELPANRFAELGSNP